MFLVPRCSPSHITPRTINKTGQVLWKLAPPEWSIMNSVPKVSSITGPRIDRSKVGLLLGVEGLLLGFIFGLRYAFVQQIQPQHDQQCWPVAQQSVDLQEIQVIQQEQKSEPDQQHWRHGESRSCSTSPSQPRKFVYHFAVPALLGGVIRLKRHVENEGRNHQAEEGHKPLGSPAAQNADDRTEDDDVQQALGILAVVDRTHSGNESQDES